MGGLAEDPIPDSTRLDVTAALAGQRRQRRATRLRLVSSFRRGWMVILGALLTQEPWPLGAFGPEPWPTGSAHQLNTLVTASGVYHAIAA